MTNMKKLLSSALLLSAAAFSSAGYAECMGAITDEFLCETREIKFDENDEAKLLKQKAAELGNPVAIYEYLRNSADYSVYHGARSNTINTFLSLAGNDVDLASTLIAMYRSQGIKSRYVVGDIELSRADVANWTGVTDEQLAVSILDDQGIKIVDDSKPSTVVFEHVWVEALLDFANYRGGSSASVCSAESDACKWIALDPSFKLKKYNPEYRNLLENVNFDYSGYYSAEKDNGDLRDKSPLEIYEEQALEYLRENHLGVTLEDVLDSGDVIREERGLLPSSLPYVLVGNLRRYPSIVQRDIDEPASYPWQKFVRGKINPMRGAYACENFMFVLPEFHLSDLSTKRLTVNWDSTAANGLPVLRLDGTFIEELTYNVVMDGVIFTGVIDWTNQSCENENLTTSTNYSYKFSSSPLRLGSPFSISLSVDALPGKSPVEVSYENLVIGGYYLLATGGETSNWTQVKRAYEQLLQANTAYPTATDAGTGDVFVDSNNDGVFGSDEKKLLEDKEAQDALTGGLLYTAQTLYYTRLKQEAKRYSRLKHIASPIAAFAGIVSSVYEVEKIDETPFAVMPGGLLIDLKGIRLNGSWESDKAETYSSEAFKFLGHMASSLEHEVWQELTGYDAVSTMRGIQVSLKAGDQLLEVHNNFKGNTYSQAVTGMGYNTQDPKCYKREVLTVYGRTVNTWEFTCDADADDALALEDRDPGFAVFRKNLSGLLVDDYRSKVRWVMNSDKLNRWLQNYDDTENHLLTLDNNLHYYPQFKACGTTYFDVSINEAIDYHKGCFNSILADNPSVEEHLKFFDSSLPGAEKFILSDHAIIPYEVDGSAQGGLFVTKMRDEMYFASNGSYEYVLPSKLTLGPNYLFHVHIKNTYSSEDALVSSTYAIQNLSNRLAPAAGGGYVPVEGAAPLDPASDTSDVIASPASEDNPTGTPDTSAVKFNNESFTDKNLVAIANNDQIRTPSTVDPVSTVTGNMYHDETDIMIAGKGLNYTFTRTYNSNATTTDGEGSANPNFLPLSQGWTHSYNMKLVANDYGKFPSYGTDLAPENGNNKTSSISYVDERGGESNYLLDDSNAASSPTSPRTGFDALVFDSPSAGLHTITYRNGVSYTFDSQSASMRTPGTVARLHTITDAYGQQLNFGYNASNQLTSVTDRIGLADRSGLTFTYYPAGDTKANRLHTISDWTGRTWTYDYDASGRLVDAQNPLLNSMTYTYVGDSHLLEDITHPQLRDLGTGQVQKSMKFGYYENGQAYNYVDQLGAEESLIYDLYRRRTRITNPNGFITTHYYDENGAMTKLVEPDSAILLFENNEDGLRYLKRDALGYSTKYSYNTDRSLTGAASDTFGQVTREQDALGNNVDYDYGIFDQVTQVTDKNGRVHSTEYYQNTDAAIGAVKGKVKARFIDQATVKGALHSNVQLASFTYNADGTIKQAIAYIDPAEPTRQRVTDYAYVYQGDGSFELTTTTTGSGKTVQVTDSYDALWRLTSSTSYRRTSVTDATQIALTTRYQHDALGRVTRTTDALGNISEVIFDANGQVEKSIAYFKLGGAHDSPLKTGCELATIDGAQYHSCTTVENTYNAADRLISQTDILGATSLFEYDAMGQLLLSTDANNHKLRYEYDSRGRRTAVVNENGYRVETDYDLAGRVLAVTDANGNSVNFQYDALGRKISSTSPEGRVTAFDQYDASGNLIKVRDANATSVADQTQAPINAQGASSFSDYDQFNRVVASLNAKDEQTRFEYDLSGNRTAVIDANNQRTEFVFDDLGRLQTVIDPIVETPADKVVSFSYDEHGNRLSHTDRLGETAHYFYDGANRLTQVDYLVDGSSDSKAYDQYGNMVFISNGGLSYSYDYDAAGRMLSKTDSRGKMLSWSYDTVGNLLSKTNYQGETQAFTYDSSNRMVSVATVNPSYIQASYHYDPAGRLLSRILSNGIATLYNYDKDGLLIRMKQITATGVVIDDRAYKHDQVGNITQQIVNRSEVIDYRYDAAYRLLGASSSVDGNSFAYSYDAVGNRLTKTFGASANLQTHHYIYSPLGNQLKEVRIGSITGSVYRSYHYDDNGSLIEKRDGAGSPLLALEYDQRRLVTAMQTGPAAEQQLGFGYDANAYRVSKQLSDAGKSKNYFLEAEHLESVYDGNNELQAKYLRGVVVDEIVNGFERNPATGELENRSFHHDQVNSAVAVSDHNGDVVQSVAYGPFGESLAESGTSLNAMRYTGRELDAETGLYYYRARYFDPEIGRFISEDPIGFESGEINHYVYVGNNPLIYNDPSGNVRWSDVGSSTLGLASASAGIFIGTTGVVGGGAMIVAPEPLTSAAGVVAVGWGAALTAKASVDWSLNAQNLYSAITESNNTVPSSGFEMVAEYMYPGDSNAQLTAVAANLTVDLMSGRAPVAAIPNVTDLRSVDKVVNISEKINYQRSLSTSEYFSTTIGYGTSSVSTSLNLLQGGILGQTAMNNWNGVETNITQAANGGFVIYPAKINSNSMTRVYSK